MKAAGGSVRGAQPALQPAADPDTDDTPAPPAPAAPAREWFSAEELCKAAGADADELAALESFGLVAASPGDDGRHVYSADDLMILRMATELATFGLEPRHLRMYKTFAVREQALFEQVVAPLLRQRNPDAGARARATLEQLARQCGALHQAVLRNTLAATAQDPNP